MVRVVMRRFRIGQQRAANERGAVAVIVAVLAIVLMSAAAFALDLGNARGVKRKAQTAADAAALAGARVIQSGGDPIAVASDYANKNGFGTATVNRPPASGSAAGNTSCIEVMSHGTIDTIFARVMGINTVNVKARAVACGTSGGGGGYAIFAESTSCNNAVDWSGSTTHVTGGLHSNNDLHVGGQVNVIDGNTSYRTTIDAPPDKIGFNPAPVQDATPRALPANFQIADYAPGGAEASQAVSQSRYYNAGSAKIDMGWLSSQGLFDSGTNTISQGLYYTTNDIDLSASSLRGDGVTFVTSDGVISLSGSQHFMRPWDDRGLLLFTNKSVSNPSNCVSAGVKLAGSTHDWGGIIFAPNLQVEMSGSSNATLNGSIIANTVKLNGSDLNITYDEDFGGGLGTIKLVE